MPKTAIETNAITDPSAPERWYALTVKTGREIAVAQALAHKRLEPFLPVSKKKRRWSDRVKVIEQPLFPGYLFCRFAPHERMPVLTTPGVRSLVGTGRCPAPVCDQEIASLLRLAASGIAPRRRPYLEQGERVVVCAGPLEGLEGRLVYTAGACEVVVSVELIERSVAVRVDRDALEPAG